MRVLSFLQGNALQYPLIRLIQARRQLVQSLSNACCHTAAQRVQLAKHPAKPVSHHEQRLKRSRTEAPYTPSTLSESVSITSCFSSTLHLRIARSVSTKDLM